MTEADARIEIVRCCALLWERRLVSGTSGNASVRLDDGDVIVTPAGRSLRALSPADLVRVSFAGSPRDDSARPSSEFSLHLAGYRERSDIRALIHTHPTFCVVWSLLARVFPQETVGSRETLGNVAWTSYHPSGSAQLAEACANQFKTGMNVVLMECHGLSAIGATLEEAFSLTDQAEEAARVAYFSALAGRTIPPANTPL
jgi:L-fuculose-phosphate aldolase